MLRPYIKNLFTPIFLFHGRELHSGGVERDHFEVNAAIRADDDLTNFGSSIQSNLGFTFRAGYSRHNLHSFGYWSPNASRSDFGLRFFKRQESFDSRNLTFYRLETRAANRISFFDGFHRVEDLIHVRFKRWTKGLIRFE